MVESDSHLKLLLPSILIFDIQSLSCLGKCLLSCLQDVLEVSDIKKDMDNITSIFPFDALRKVNNSPIQKCDPFFFNM
jgi:hypothetical protein